MLSDVTKAVQRRRTENPRTVLAFFGTVLGLVLTADVAATAVLAHASVYLWLIPWLLGFAALVFVLLVSGIFVVTLIDPSKLMLGHVTGTEYAEIQRVTLGDTRLGEHVVEMVPAPPIPALPAAVSDLSEPQPAVVAEQEGEV